jgi:hypothetical protein
MYHEAIMKKNYLMLGLVPSEVDKLPNWMTQIWDLISREEHIKSTTMTASK